ncbi:Uncharacterized protein OBRU01_02952 [Operophtera brumata]|uniref:Carboxylesterase type B domain-containing protein n=1 Tax=Operophtera brumata TaxID=104452 RepID=A0A0L7LKE5_OPEBR|nr:Uncharacterized protein OBRU01_02952 [Operophtera brumata]
MKGALCVLFLVGCVYGAEVRVDPLVLISGQGLVSGQRATDGDYSKFLGIPYAQVDTDNPFGPSLEPAPFVEIIHNANDGSAKCPQLSSDDKTSIDCLRLNIFVPSSASSRSPLPVLFWIHGGDFSSGSAGGYSGVRNIVRHGVVVVTINYRLGPYGFLCLGIPSLPGNQGLKDQFEALRWVRKNIASFGGNPYNVTIAGQDAGATSALLHLYSRNDKLFHKAIIESGTPQNEGMFVNGDVDAAIKLAERLGLNTTDSKEAVEYLIKTDHDLVAVAALDLKLSMKPCKERSFSGIENFVEYDPYALTNEKKVQNTPVLIGYTNKERDSLNDEYYKSDPFYSKLKNNFNLDDIDALNAAKTVQNFYIGDKAISTEVASELKDFESDFDFNHPAQRTIVQLLNENAGAVYEYLFSYVGNSEVEGAGHSAELSYLFELSNEQKTIEDQLVIDRITYLWGNFIKYGNPTPEITELVPVSWPAVSKATRPTLVIDTNLRVEGRVDNQRMAFWDLFYSVYGKYNKIVRECSMM